MCTLKLHAWDPCCFWVTDVVTVRSICARPGCRTSKLERFR